MYGEIMIDTKTSEVFGLEVYILVIRRNFNSIL